MKWSVTAYRKDKLVARLDTDSAVLARDLVRRWKLLGFKVESYVPKEPREEE